MNTIENISNIIKGLFLVIVLSSVFACSKGGEPIPMSSSNSVSSESSSIETNSSLSSQRSTDSSKGVVGGDDNEDDDDNRGNTFPRRR